jgi:hypothetical protein
MKTKKLLSEILSKELTAGSNDKLSKLYKLVCRKKEDVLYSGLYEAISQSEIIRIIFRNAKICRQKIPDAISKDYFDNREIMEALGISKRTLAQWRTTGILPYFVFQNKCYYKIEEVEKLLSKNYKGVET